MAEPAREAGDSIKPGVKRQRNPRTQRSKKVRAREAGDSGNKLRIVDLQALSPASRAWEYCIAGGPGVPLTLHPRLYAVARFAGWTSWHPATCHWRVILWEPLPT